MSKRIARDGGHDKINYENKKLFGLYISLQEFYSRFLI